MALTQEQADKIEIDEDMIVGFSLNGGDICAGQLSRWAYRRLETWPDLLDALRNLSDTHLDSITDGKGCNCQRCFDASEKAQQVIAKISKS
jgi:hypothetical protein